MAICKLMAPPISTDPIPQRGDSTKKAEGRGIVGIAPHVRLTSHADHEVHNGRGIGIKNALAGRDDQISANGGDAILALLGWKKGGKNKKRTPSRVVAEVKPIDPTFVGAYVRSGKITFSEGWDRLANPKERDEILQAIEKVAKMGDELRSVLSAPAGIQVMSAPIHFGYIAE